MEIQCIRLTHIQISTPRDDVCQKCETLLKEDCCRKYRGGNDVSCYKRFSRSHRSGKKGYHYRECIQEAVEKMELRQGGEQKKAYITFLMLLSTISCPTIPDRCYQPTFSSFVESSLWSIWHHFSWTFWLTKIKPSLLHIYKFHFFFKNGQGTLTVNNSCRTMKLTWIFVMISTLILRLAIKSITRSMYKSLPVVWHPVQQ